MTHKWEDVKRRRRARDVFNRMFPVAIPGDGQFSANSVSWALWPDVVYGLFSMMAREGQRAEARRSWGAT